MEMSNVAYLCDSIKIDVYIREFDGFWLTNWINLDFLCLLTSV